MDANRFKGQSAFVTGSATGIGEACARKLAAGGAAVAICDFNEEGGRRVAEDIGNSGGQAVYIKADLTDWEQTQAAVVGFKDRHGRLDILVHSAGGFPKYVSLLDCPVDAWDAVVNSNLKSMFYLLKVAAPLMIEGGYGRFVSLSSMAARSGVNPNPPHYTAAKAGVLGLTRQAASELGPHGITVNAVAPANVLTPRTRSIRSQERIAHIEKTTPVGRL
ncbi:MAG: SDR family oxidoreductase, partial [Nitrospinaceae bacterium]|nr:SDR family oxidoreductase [Nitrospinaceae bacterium]